MKKLPRPSFWKSPRVAPSWKQLTIASKISSLRGGVWWPKSVLKYLWYWDLWLLVFPLWRRNSGSRLLTVSGHRSLKGLLLCRLRSPFAYFLLTQFVFTEIISFTLLAVDWRNLGNPWLGGALDTALADCWIGPGFIAAVIPTSIFDVCKLIAIDKETEYSPPLMFFRQLFAFLLLLHFLRELPPRRPGPKEKPPWALL